MSARLTLVTRAFCPLCDEMHNALQNLHLVRPFELAIADVDAGAQLLRQWDWRVPVLLAQNGEPVCEGHFDEAAVIKHLGRIG